MIYIRYGSHRIIYHKLYITDIQYAITRESEAHYYYSLLLIRARTMLPGDKRSEKMTSDCDSL